MATLDILAISIYFVAVLSAGLWFRKRASQNLEAYFLGGKSLHWSLLAASGAVSTFDITGTMWMVSVLYLLGMQSWWHHWMWGVALPAFALAYMARWVRRSKVLTAAEWMKTRFGDGPGGRTARYSYALVAVVFTAVMIGYAFQGIGKFAAVYLPLEPVAGYLQLDSTTTAWLTDNQAAILATLILSATTIYVVIGGLYSVVITDVIQTVILTGAGILIAAIAYMQVTPELIERHVSPDFARLIPQWRMEHFAGHPEHGGYEMFGYLVMAWILKGFLMNAGGPAQMYDFQRYLAAPSVRDAAKIAAAWPFFLVVRWGMVMGITLLAMTGIMSVSDPEQVMPEVLQEYLPPGVRGFVIAGLLAAFMSTFSSTVNSGASFIVRDLWQPLVQPGAGERSLIRCSYVATVVLVVCGILCGTQAKSISHIWQWMMMALTGGVVLPNVLRWYWWRLNGWGYAAGVLGGMLLAVVALFVPEMPLYQLFPIICAGSLVASIAVSYSTSPTDSTVLDRFQETVRPFGLWKSARRHREEHRESAWLACGNTLIGIVGLTALYLGPMYLVGHWHGRALICALLFLAVFGVLYLTWYRRLPADG